MGDLRSLDIVLATDTRGLLGAAVTGRSIVDNSLGNRPIRFHLLHDELDEEVLWKLARSWQSPGRSVSLISYPFRVDRVRHLLRSKSVTHMAYARLFLGEAMPEDCHRCLYCDIDLMVERDIGELHDLNLQGAVVAAVPNYRDSDGLHHFERLGAVGRKYFNSGVLLVDLDRWRGERVGPRALEIAERLGDRLTLYDQDALNVLLADSWLELGPEWNWWDPTPPPEGLPVVIHAAMTPKPWHLDYRGPHRERFERYLGRTEFAGDRPKRWFGFGPAAARLNRLLPHWPTVIRRLKGLVRGG